MNDRPDFASLKQRHRACREQQPQDLATRIHRALSWLQRAERETGDIDARFIFLWIALNAAYAKELPQGEPYSETRSFLRFLDQLIRIDRHHRLYDLVWEEFLDSIRGILDSKYCFKPFWLHLKGIPNTDDWEQKFRRSRASAERALERMDTRKLLLIVFERIYVLRNQLMHGNATWNSRLNRPQLEQATAFLDHLVPVIIELLIDSERSDWGTLCYPVVD
jgi:hypothetical protein